MLELLFFILLACIVLRVFFSVIGWIIKIAFVIFVILFLFWFFGH